MGMNSENNDCNIELKFNNKWKYIPSVRLFVHNVIYEHRDDKEASYKISLAASELVENAVKFNTDADNAHVYLKLSHNQKDKQIILEVQNFCSDNNIEILKSELNVIMLDKPYESYVKKIQDPTARKKGKSMLGLARVRYESDCDLSLHIDKDLVTVRATFNVPT